MAKRERRKFQVFISSTYKDLIDERQAIIKALLEARQIPAGMEHFTAYNETQLETMYRWIDESDFYLLLLGGSYGTIDKVRGKSYTQLEYEYAIKKDKDVRVIVLSDEYLAAKQICQEQNYINFKELVGERAKEIAHSIDGIEKAVFKICIDYGREHDFGGWVRAESASENDTEIIKLTGKMEALEKENQELSEKVGFFESERFGEYTFDGLVKVLNEKSIVDKNGKNITLLDLFKDNFDQFVAGFAMDDYIEQNKKLYGTLTIFRALGLLWVVKNQILRASAAGNKFYARFALEIIH